MLFLRGIILVSLVLLTTPEQTGVVEGTIVCEGTLEPVAGAHISVGEFRTVSDSTGHFVIRNARAGATSVRAEHPAFFGPTINGNFTRVAIAPVIVRTSAAANVNITLVPAASISGSVFDSRERPMRDAVVGLLRVVHHRGTRTFEVIDAKVSGKQGEYRIYPVPPGEYYVGVAPSETSDSTTLYPNTTHLSRARSVRVNAADDVKGIDIHTQEWVISSSMK